MNNPSLPFRQENYLQASVRWGITLIWAAMIFTLSTARYGGAFSALLLHDFLELVRVTVSPAAFDVLHHLLRKSAHVAEYAMLGLLLYHCLLKSNRAVWRPREAVWTVLIAGAYSLTDEFHQAFVPGRGPSLADCGLDTMAAALGMIILYAWTYISGGRDAGGSLPQEQPADPA